MSQIFSFQDHPVRTHTENGQPWFAGSDIAKLLGYARPEKEVRRICKHVKLLKPTSLVGWGNSPRGFLIIPEADVWRLIVRSTLPKAQEIEEWIMSDVLPAIRKTGKYEAKTTPKPLPLPTEALPTAAPDSRLSKRTDPERKALTALVNTWVGQAPIHYAAARVQVNARFGVASVDDLTVAQVKEAFSKF